MTESVVVACDAPIFSEAVRRHADSDERLDVVECVQDGAAALEACRRHQPSVVLIADPLPGPHGLYLLAELRACAPNTGVVVLSCGPSAISVHEALASGARGYLVRSEAGPAVVEGLVRVARGRTAISEEAEVSLVEAVRTRSDGTDAVPTGRESEILRLLAAGATSREVGEQLFLSESTVKTYLRRLYGKLAVTDRAAAVASAMRRGWLA